MKEYKVVRVCHDDEKIYDSEHRFDVGYDMRSGQEYVLNYYAKQGFYLVAVASGDEIGSFGENLYLYLCRDV